MSERGKWRKGARNGPSPSRASAERVALVGRKQLAALRAEVRARAASTARWNASPDDVQRSVAQLVLSIVEFVRKLLERQAIRRMDARTLSPREVEAVGLALMKLEEAVREMAARFGLDPEDLSLDLGPLGRLH